MENKQELSKQEKMIKDVFDNKKFLTEESEINYSCNACGRCCHNQDILISTLDILRLRRHFNAPTVAFAQDYLTVYPGSNSKMPVCLLQFIETPTQDKLSICPFLRPVFYKELEDIDKKGKTEEQIKDEYEAIIKKNVEKNNMSSICSIHLNKPEICRLYPLGRGFQKSLDSDKIEMKLFMVDKEKLACDDSCYGCQHKRTVKDLLTANNLGMFPKTQEDYNRNIMALGEISSKGKLSDNEYSMLASLFYNFDAILFYQRLANNPKAKGAMEKVSGYEKVKEIYQDVPELDKDLLMKTTNKEATDEETGKAYEHLVSIQTLVINNLVKKYADTGNGDKKN